MCMDIRNLLALLYVQIICIMATKPQVSVKCVDFLIDWCFEVTERKMTGVKNFLFYGSFVFSVCEFAK